MNVVFIGVSMNYLHELIVCMNMVQMFPRFWFVGHSALWNFSLNCDFGLESESNRQVFVSFWQLWFYYRRFGNKSYGTERNSCGGIGRSCACSILWNDFGRFWSTSGSRWQGIWIWVCFEFDFKVESSVL